MIEIERKYVLKTLPAREVLDRDHDGLYLHQGYLPGEVIHERFTRRVQVQLPCAETFVRAVKIGNGLTRQEFNERVSKDIFLSVWPLTLGRRIEKTRFRVKEGDLCWEIDLFTDRSLFMAEVEIPDETVQVVLPDWLAPLVDREVTGDARYEGFYMGK